MQSTLAASTPLSSLTPASPAAIQTGTALKSSLSATDRATLAKKTGVEFESFFVSSMLESMTAGLKADKMFGGGGGEDMFHSLLNQQYGAAIAARGTLGIASVVQKEILRLQEQAA